MGIGFGKNLDHNLALLSGLSALAALGLPVLVGASRKAFIGKILDLGPDERLEGSIAAAVAAALGGANIVRVHDVKEAARALRVADALRFGAPEKRATRHQPEQFRRAGRARAARATGLRLQARDQRLPRRPRLHGEVT